MGALIAGSLIKYGKLYGIKVANVLLLLSIGICLTGNIYAIAFARFFWGVSAGAFSVLVPTYLAEFTPIDLRHVFGSLINLCVSIGFVIPAAMSIALCADPAKALAGES